MEQLSPELRQKVIKMSEARLRRKLVQAGYREVDISTFDRATLLEYYAKVLLTETAYVPAKRNKRRVKRLLVMVKRRLSLLRVMPGCNTLPAVISQLKKSV